MMERRKELAVGTILNLGGVEYHIEGMLGKGSCALLYKAWYNDATIFGAKHHVLVKELFPFDIKGGILRKTENEIEVSSDAQSQYELYKSSFIRGNQIQLNILERFPEKNGVNINTYSYNNTLYSVLGFGGGRDFETELLINPDTPLIKQTERLIGVLSALDEFHKMGYYHLDISTDNILIVGKGDEERVVLIDYNSVLSEKEIQSDAELFLSSKKGYSAPELRTGMKNKISPATDLYSVAAVFFRTLSNRALTEFEMIRRMPPDVSECRLVKESAETVKSQIRKILVKGLCQLPEKRYCSVREMREDFSELKERILGLGITHWSVWESSRKSVQEFVRSNTAFSFVKDRQNLYSLNVQTGNDIRTAEDFLNDILKGAPSAVLHGDGGMGKTTCLLSLAYNAGARYSSSAPAIAYVSLYGAAPSDENYIKDKLLESLRFKTDTKTFQTARHKLKQMLKDVARETGSPSVVILIDGFNEIRDNAQLIINEIRELSQNRGIRFVVTTRQYNGELGLEKATMVQLKDSEVQNVLLKEGLLLPQNREIADLLKNPLMLSIFIEASKNGSKQLKIKNRHELVAEYFSAISKKEVGSTKESEREVWQKDVAVNYVLPAIAEEIRKKKRALSDEELFPVVKKCYNVLSSKLVSGAFGEWIGNVNNILAGCKTPESWYGLVVQDILWRKTGLLSKNEKGRYRIFHQLAEEYLLDINRANSLKVNKRVFIKNTALLSGVAAVFMAVCVALTAAFPELAEKSVFVRLRAVDKEKANSVLSDMCVSYVNSGCVYDIAKLLVQSPEDEKNLLRKFEFYKASITAESRMKSIAQTKMQMEEIEDDGGIMPYSYETFSVAEGKTLLEKDTADIDLYSRYINLLLLAQKNNNSEYVTAFEKFIQADAEYTAMLFQYTVWEHIDDMDNNSVLKKTLLDSVSVASQMENIRTAISEKEKNVDSYTVATYRETRKSLCENMENLYGKYEILYQNR